MRITNKIISKIKDQRGATAVVVAVVLAMLIGFLALAIDVGYLYATKNELQNVADSAALAATNYLGNIYTGLNHSQLDTYNCSTAGDCALIIAQAQNVVGSGKNIAGGENIAIDSGDIIIGKWDGDSLTFTATNGYPGELPDAVKVTARRDSTAVGNGPIGTFFAKIFGINTVDVKADAIADLSGASAVTEGGLPLPVGIGKVRFESEYCDKPIKFYPSNDLEACGGWHVFVDDKTKIKQDILDGMLDDPPTWTSPYTEAGAEFYFSGGTDNSAWVKIKEIFDNSKGLNDLYTDSTHTELKKNPIDADLDPDVWTTTVVVYDRDDCSNPNTAMDEDKKSLSIIGFARIRIYEVCTALSDPSVPIEGGGVAYDPEDPLPPPPEDYCLNGEKKLVALIACDFIEPQRGGGGEYGIIGSIAGLVE